jgi:hypothetical protein
VSVIVSSRGIREDLGGLLECFVLVDRDQHGGRFAVAGHQDVVTTIGDIAQ